jgi:hypothetical protein
MRLNFHNYSVYGNDVLFKAGGNYFIIAHYHSFETPAWRLYDESHRPSHLILTKLIPDLIHCLIQVDLLGGVSAGSSVRLDPKLLKRPLEISQ